MSRVQPEVSAPHPKPQQYANLDTIQLAVQFRVDLFQLALNFLVMALELAPVVGTRSLASHVLNALLTVIVQVLQHRRFHVRRERIHQLQVQQNALYVRLVATVLVQRPSNPVPQGHTPTNMLPTAQAVILDTNVLLLLGPNRIQIHVLLASTVQFRQQMV